MAAAAEPLAAAAPGRWRRILSRSNPSLLLGLGIVALVALVAVVVPLLSPYGAEEINAGDSLAGPATVSE